MELLYQPGALLSQGKQIRKISFFRVCFSLGFTLFTPSPSLAKDKSAACQILFAVYTPFIAMICTITEVLG